MRKGQSFAVGALLLSVVVLLGACGGGDDAPRSFDDEPAASNPAKQLPPQVKSEVQLSYKKGKFQVDVSADRDYCVGDRTVAILELGKRKDVKVGRLTTDADGNGSRAEKKAAGKFVAEVKKEPSAEYGDLSICLGDTSPPKKV